MGVFQKIIGDPNERVIKDLQLTVNLINEWGPRVVNKTPEELRQRTQEFKEEYQAIAKDKGIKAADNYLDEILPEAFAMVREASNRTLGQRPVSYTHLRAHETPEHLVCRLLLEKKKQTSHKHD